MYIASVKDDRLQLRVDPESKRLLEQAAAAAHLTMSAFVLRAAAQEAESVLAERSLISLSPDAAPVFSQALERPGRVNKHLADGLGRRRKFGWLG